MNYKTKDKIKTIAFGAIAVAVIGGILAMNIHYKSNASSEEYLQQNGFTQTHITGYKWTCARGTLRTFEFRAVDKNGNDVEGYVCATRLFLDDNITIEKINKSKPKM